MGMKFGAEILPGQLYQRGLFDRWPIEQKMELIVQGRIGAVACLVNRHDIEMAQLLGRSYIFYPVSDGRVVDRGLEFIAYDLSQVIRLGKAVIVHCRAGRNRSGLLAALVVREVTGCTGKEALEIVQERRPNALANPHFCAYLRSLPTTREGSDETTVLPDR
jgi:hypothetical protein